MSALVKFESDPTLAETISALDATKVVNRFTTADYVFKNRFDYHLWRILAIPDARGGVARNWGQPAAIAYRGLKEGGDIQVWGVIQALAKELAKQTRLKTLTLDELTELVAPCCQRLHHGLKFLEGAKAGCAFARINILCGLDSPELHRFRNKGIFGNWLHLFPVLSRRLAYQSFENYTHVFGMFKTRKLGNSFQSKICLGE